MTRPWNSHRNQGPKTNRRGRRPRLELLEDRVLLATFTVTDTSDSVSDTGSLRYAITQSNMTSPGPNVIDFDISGTGVQTITQAAALPTITVPVTIAGTSQPGYSGTPLIVLNGSNAGSSANGLDLNAANSTITGLAVDNFGSDGIVLSGSGDVLTGCFVGVDATGEVAAGNGGFYAIDCTAGGITIGGTAAGAGNVISGNSGNAIQLQGSGTGDVVQGNFIGTDVTGTKALANHGNGILVQSPGGVLIGGTVAGARNIISGNDGTGITIYTASDLIEGNYIGTDVTGTLALPNQNDGVVLANEGSGVATGLTTVGGTAAGAANVISGNAGSGIDILTNSNVVEGNFIGTNAAGTAAVGNAGPGVAMGGEPGGVGNDNTIGGTVAAARNVISGNDGGAGGVGGISLGNAGSGNVIEGNYIGTDVTGTIALANKGDGIGIGGSNGDTIGGTTAGAGNVIAGNTGDGVDLYIADALVEGNFIGTDATGTKALPNGGDGVDAGNVSNETIGGTTAAARNIISANAEYGISIAGGDTTTDSVQGNYIGTDVTGTEALGNGYSGVYITCQSNTIGGTTPGAGNLISANGTANSYEGNAGITISGGNFGTTGNAIQGNLIGTDVTGTLNLGNVGDGVYITGGANSNTIGGSAANAPNVIAFNGLDGVNVDNTSMMDLISQNSIFGNTNLGIDLENAGGNAGGNNQEPAPILTSYTALGGGSIQTGWTLTAAPMTTYTIEFFASALGSADGVSEGQTFLTSMPETTGAAGTVSFTLTASLPAGQTFVTATATDPNDNTSQFSLQASTTVLTSSVNPSIVGQNVTFTAVVSNPGTGTPTGTVTFTIDGHAETPATLSVVAGVDQAVFSTSTLALGSHTISAVYSGDTAFATSTSATLTQAASSTPLATSTTLSAAPNPSTFGQNVTFIAAVAPASGSGTPTGTVIFTIDGQAEPPVDLAVVNGIDQATFSTSSLAVGPHTITAAYSGDTTFAPSTPTNSLIETVNPLPLLATSTQVTSSLNPSTLGQSVTFTAAVAPASGSGTPTGTVIFTIDGQAEPPVDLAVVNGVDQAVFATSSLAVGTHTVSAAYSGDATFATSTTTLTQTIDVVTTTTLQSSTNPSVVGQSVTFTATVAGTTGGGTPSGSVSFEEGSTTLQSVTLDAAGQATFTTSTLALGSDIIVTVYAASGDFLTSSSAPLTQVVNPVPLEPTSTQVTSSANPSTAGQGVTFTAVVSTSGPGTPTGTVTFTVDGQPQTPVDLEVVGNDDEASLPPITDLAAGAHTITATYDGDSTFAGSAATTPLVQTVASAGTIATTTTLFSSSDPSTFGQAVTFSALISAASGASAQTALAALVSSTGTPTGTVTFFIDGKAQTPVDVQVIGGQDEALLPPITDLSTGPHTIAATYSGDSSYAGSAATPLTQTVATVATSTSVASSGNPSTAGQSVVLTATVGPGTGQSVPTGTVTFTINGKAGTPVPLTDVDGRAQATITMPATTAGSYTITASYSGDVDFAASTSSATTEVVSPASTPPSTDGPTVVSVLRYGYHMMPTTVVLTFDQALDATTAEDDANYRITGPTGQSISVKSADYDPTTLSVTLHFTQRISIHKTYELTVDGTAPHGLTNTLGLALDGADTGRPDSDYHTSLTWRNLVLDPPWPKKPRLSKGATANVKVKSAAADAVNHGAGLFTRSLGFRR